MTSAIPWSDSSQSTCGVDRGGVLVASAAHPPFLATGDTAMPVVRGLPTVLVAVSLATGAGAQTTLLTNVTVIDGTGAPPRPGTTIGHE